MRNISSLALITIVILIHDTCSFHIPSQIRTSKRIILSASTSPSPSSFSKGGIDLERARECVGNSGACDIEEMEQLRDALKAERMKDFISSSLFYLYPTGAPSSPWNPNDSLEKRLLEDTLSQQLQQLKEQQPLHQVSTTSSPSSIPSSQEMNDMIAFLNEPSTEEMMTVCFVVALMMIFPFIANVM